MNVLITSASRKVSLVQAFQKALKKEGGGKIITADINPMSAALQHSDLSYIVPRDSDPNFIPKLLALCKKEKIRLIVPTRDEELLIFARNKAKFRKEGIIIHVPDIQTTEICGDKLNFIKFCERNRIPVPKTYTYREIKKGKVKFPLFVNDRQGKGSKKAAIATNQKDLDFHLKSIDKPIIQECIEAKEYTTDLFADFESNIISVVPRERVRTFGGESFVGKTYKNKVLIEANINLAQELKLSGHNTIQCFFNGKNLHFIEVNPRYGGGANLGIAAGADTPLYLIQLLKGKKLKSKIGKFEDNLVMLRYTQDTFINEKRLKCKKI